MIDNEQSFNFVPIYVLHGDESFLLIQRISELEKLFKQQNPEEQNIKIFDCTTTDIKEIFNYASLNSLVGKQMIIVKNIQNCKDLSNKKIADFFKKYSKNPNLQNILVLCSDKSLLATNIFLKTFSQYKIELFKKLKEDEIVKFIKQNTKNSPIDDSAIALLRLFTGDDLQILSQELKKITEYNCFEVINEAIVSEYISFQRNYNPFEFLNAIIEKNLSFLEQIFNHNDNIDAIPIVALLYTFFSKIMMMHTDKNAKKTFFQKYYQDAMKVYTLEKIEYIMGLLWEADLQLKGINTTYIDDKEILRGLIFNIVL